MDHRATRAAHARDSGTAKRNREQEEGGHLSNMWSHLKGLPKATHFAGQNNEFLKAGRLGDKLIKLKITHGRVLRLPEP